ncbi:MAG: hypothetical protein, partial [Olavius algarvensis Gamma 1 endosymbiont]
GLGSWASLFPVISPFLSAGGQLALLFGIRGPPTHDSRGYRHRRVARSPM